MFEARTVEHPRLRMGPVVWIGGSALLHTLLLLCLRGGHDELDPGRPFNVPAQLEFGISAAAPGGGDASKEPPPKPAAAPKAPPKRARVRPAPDPSAYGPAHPAAEAHHDDSAAAHGGTGHQPDALGAGLGAGLGPGSGYAPAGATIALNVDLARVRQTALVLETGALLDIIPEWQELLAGSGLDPLQDLERVFVASPTLERSSVVVAARHHIGRTGIDAAVSRLASEQGKGAAFHEQQGFDVAAWRNRGPTERVIALTGPDQFTITRSGDLARVLQVAASLGRARREQGFGSSEVSRQGGLLAMKDQEAVALWVEGVGKYVPGEAEGVPQSLRMSVYHVDQFNTELRVRGQYASAASATAAWTSMDALRAQLSDHPKVVFLGLKSALDRAHIEQAGAALLLNVRLTLHQTRYLLRFVTRALRPRAS